MENPKKKMISGYHYFPKHSYRNFSHRNKLPFTKEPMIQTIWNIYLDKIQLPQFLWPHVGRIFFLFFGSPTKVGIDQVEKISMVEILLSPKVYSQTFFGGPGLHACDSTSTITNGRPIPSRGKPPWSFRTELADFTSLGPRILVVEIWPGSPLHATRLNRNTKFERELEKWGVTTSRHGFVLLCLFLLHDMVYIYRIVLWMDDTNKL